MPRHRIKAYFIHESEQAAAQRAVGSAVITDAEWTQGYVMGIVDSTDIEALEKDGLVVFLVEEFAQADSTEVTDQSST